MAADRLARALGTTLADMLASEYVPACARSATSAGYSYMMRMSISLNLMSCSAFSRPMRLISWLASLPLSLMRSTTLLL